MASVTAESVAARSLGRIGIGLLESDSGPANSLLACLRHLPARIVDLPPALEQGTLLRLRLEQSRPDVLVVDVTGSQDHLAGVMAIVGSVSTPPAVVAIGEAPSGDFLLEVLHTGVSEFLYPPFEQDAVWRALERLVRKRGDVVTAPAGGKVIAFLSAMGGCGATMLACHMAAELHRTTRERVLLADFDFASGMTGFWTGVKSPYSMLDVARALKRLDDNLWSKFVGKAPAGFDAMPVPELLPVDEICPAELLVEATRFTCFSYDWVIADLGHGLSPATLALAALADTLFVVTTAEIAVLHQLKRVLRKLEDAGLGERARLVLNRLRKEQRFYREEFETVLSKPFEVILPEDVPAVEEAHAERRVISARSGLGKGIETLAAKVSGIATEQKPRSRFSMFR